MTSVGSGIAGASAGAVLGAVTSWVVQGASWLLGQIGGVLTSTTTVDLGAGWFTRHYEAMAALAAVVVLPLLVLSVVQAVYRQSAALLVRVVAVQLPLALLLTGAAVQLVQLSLAVTDALGAGISAGAGVDVHKALQGVASELLAQAGGGPDSAPAFVVLLGALLVAVAAFALWLELLVRAAAVYVAVLFLPMALASLVWPAVSHWCRRLVDTLVALVLAKFVVVAVLSLAAAALASGTRSGFSSVLGGAALLLLAAATPFVLLRLVPMVEAGAVHQLEGARHRVGRSLGSAPKSAATYALRSARSSPLVTGMAGTGVVPDFGVPGDAGGVAGASPAVGDPDGGEAGSEGGPTTRSGTGVDRRARRGGRARTPVPGGAATGLRGQGEELPGLPGIPPWRATPPRLDADKSAPPFPDRDQATPRDPLGRGPIPVRGGPPIRRDTETVDEGERRTAMTIGHDQYGPVVADWDRSRVTGPPGRGKPGEGSAGEDRGGVTGGP